MARVIVLVDHSDDFRGDPAGREVMAARDYISGPTAPVAAARPRGRAEVVKVINLSRDYAYLGTGYYASLLAEARGHKVIPSASTLVEMGQRGRAWTAIQDLDRTLIKTVPRLKEPPEGPFTLTVMLGRPDDARFARLARQAFDLFRCPVLRLRIVPDPTYGWLVRRVAPASVADLKPDLRAVFHEALDAHTRVGWRGPRPRTVPRHTLAILHDPKEAMPPSDPRALERFARAGRELGLAVEFIGRRDYARLAEFDALFIRQTTAIDHHTFRFARKAADEGMPVIDDPASILRCTNKVYLAELLAANGVATPRTVIVGRRRLKTLEAALSYPMVLKIPDGSFSRGVVKVGDRAALEREGRRLLEESDLILAQEYVYTPFDWRVGVLDGRPLYVCKYLMARGHWQIYDHAAVGGTRTGRWETLAVEAAPPEVVRTAVGAARLMGRGLYGVDLKESPRGPLVIEVNDNPSIDAGVEDQVAKGDLYRAVMEHFVRLLEAR